MITFVIFASGLKYVGVGTTALGWILSATAVISVVTAGLGQAVARPRGPGPGAGRGSGGHRSVPDRTKTG